MPIASPSDLLPFAALGLFGSLHCAGMCGGFAVAVAGRGAGTRGLTSHLVLHALGKAATYGVLGLAASLGWRLLAPDIVSARTAVSWIAGTVMVLLGLATLGIRLFPGRRRLPEVLTRGADRIFSALRALPGSLGTVGIGVANGLVPCGLSWGAIALAAPAPPDVAVLGPFVFGLATSPALAAVTVGAGILRLRSGRAAPFLLGTSLLLFGAFTLQRGLPEGSCCGTDRPAPPSALGQVPLPR